MTVTIYRSTDGSAPTLANSAGQLTTLLDAVLVNGYGAKAAAGWAIEYTGTNKRVYRAPSGTRLRLRVDDSGGSGFARVVGYESMSDVDTGTAPFPTAAQVSGGLYWYYANGSARGWVIAATDRQVILHFQYDSTSTWTSGLGWYFGDLVSFKSGDAYHCVILGNNTASASTNLFQAAATPGSTVTGHYLARAYTQLGASLAVGKCVANMFPAGESGVVSGGTTYPDPVTGRVRLARWQLVEPSGVAHRGYFPGMWHLNHSTFGALANGDTISGTTGSDFDGKTVEFRMLFNSRTFMLETTDTW